MTLIRQTQRRTAYYSIALYPTLFDDFLLIHHCGKACSKKASRSYFQNKKEALYASLGIIQMQQNRGFMLLKNQKQEKAPRQ